MESLKTHYRVGMTFIWQHGNDRPTKNQRCVKTFWLKKQQQKKTQKTIKASFIKMHNYKSSVIYIQEQCIYINYKLHFICPVNSMAITRRWIDEESSFQFNQKPVEFL